LLKNPTQPTPQDAPCDLHVLVHHSKVVRTLLRPQGSKEEARHKLTNGRESKGLGKSSPLFMVVLLQHMIWMVASGTVW